MLPRQKIWNAMRVLKVFDFITLKMVTEVKDSTIKNYLWGLKRTEYIKELEKDKFIFIKNTGPKHLTFNRVGNKIVSATDPNLLKTLEIQKDNLSNSSNLEEFISKKESFVVEDISHIFSSKAVAKSCLQRLIKKGKVIKLKERKEGTNWIGVYKYIGGKQ